MGGWGAGAFERAGMWSNLRELIAARELLATWTMREFHVRYRQSVLGVLWAILQPLALMIVFTIVVSIFLEAPSQQIPYPVFAYCAVLPWTCFAGGLTSAIPSLANNFNLVSKVYFPREILPLAGLFVSVLDFLIAALAFAPLLVFYGIQIGPAALWSVVALAVQLVLTLAIALTLAALHVFYRDIRFVIPLVLQVWMYLSPVLYPVTAVPPALRPIYMLNPMATLIDTYRRAVLANQPPDWPFFGLAAAVASAAIVMSYRYFKHAERRFADLI